MNTTAHSSSTPNGQETTTLTDTVESVATELRNLLQAAYRAGIVINPDDGDYFIETYHDETITSVEWDSVRRFWEVR